MSAELKVIESGIRNLKLVPENLRKLADDLESGQYADALSAIVILGFERGSISVYGYGEHASPLECGGWLARAQVKISAMDESERG